MTNQQSQWRERPKVQPAGDATLREGARVAIGTYRYRASARTVVIGVVLAAVGGTLGQLLSAAQAVSGNESTGLLAVIFTVAGAIGVGIAIFGIWTALTNLDFLTACAYEERAAAYARTVTERRQGRSQATDGTE